MHYILDKEGYVEEISFGGIIECKNNTCSEYTGKVPTGYDSLENWFLEANIRAYKIVDGDLVYDSSRDYRLQTIYEQETNDNRYVTRKELGIASAEQTQAFADIYPSHETERKRILTTDPDDQVGNLPIEKLEITTDAEVTNLLELVFSMNNILPVQCTSSSNNGIDYKVEGSSIFVSGTATEKSSFNIAGNDTSVKNIFTFKKNIMYIPQGIRHLDIDWELTDDNKGIRYEFYHYDGVDRTLIGTYDKDAIIFDKDVNVTQIVLTIDKGVTVYDWIEPTFYIIDEPVLPMIEYKGNLLGYGSKTFTTFYQENGLNIPAGTYTFSAKITSDDTNYQYSRVYFYDIDGYSLGYINLTRNTRSSATITIDKTAVRVTLYASVDYNNSNGKTATYEDIQLEEGTIATEYKPYNGKDGWYYVDGVSTQETRSGKNLLDNKFRQGSESSTSTLLYIFTSNAKRLNSGTYTFSNDLPNTMQYAVFGTINNFPNSDAKEYNSGWKTGNITFTISQPLYIGVLIRKTDGTNITPSDVETIKFQIELGSATEYEPYGASPSPEFPSEIINKYKAGTYKAVIDYKLYILQLEEDLRGLPNGVGDRLWIDPSGIFDIERKVGSVVLDGSEEIGISTSNENYSSFYIIQNDMKISSSLLSNYFMQMDIGYATSAQKQGIASHTSLQRMYITLSKDVVSDLATFKTWLSTHNTEVYYELATYTSKSYGMSMGQIDEPHYYGYEENRTLINLDNNVFTPNDKIIIEQNSVVLKKGTGEEIYLDDVVMPRTYYPETYAYSQQDVYLKMTYKDIRNVDITKINLKGLVSITDIETQYNFTNDDLTKVQNYIAGNGVLTKEEIELYDINGDGVITSYDYETIKQMIEETTPNKITGTLEINSTKSQRTIVLRDEEDNIKTSVGLNGITTPSLSVGGIPVNNALSYSTEEQVVGTWIDGKPIYRKVVIINSIGSNVNYDVPYDIKNPDTIWINEACSFIKNEYETLSVNWIYSTTDYMRIWINKNLGLRVKALANLSNYSAYITIEYTKTTD